MNLSLANKRALVCGSSQGIGRACAVALADLGASITLLARDAAALVAGGFELREVTLVDLFADTLHVELVARFERAAVVQRSS